LGTKFNEIDMKNILKMYSNANRLLDLAHKLLDEAYCAHMEQLLQESLFNNDILDVKVVLSPDFKPASKEDARKQLLEGLIAIDIAIEDGNYREHKFNDKMRI